jgi:hypothetical protein
MKLTTDKPRRQKQYPLSPKQEAVMEKIVDKMLQAKIVQFSKSGYNAPAYLVREANFDINKAEFVNQWRLALDYRRVTSLTLPEHQSLDSLSQTCQAIFMAQARFYSCYDLPSAFHHLPLAEKSREITGFSTRTIHGEFTRVAMGLRNSPAIFMAELYDIFRGEVSGNKAIYMDDSITIHSSFSEHISFLRTVFEKKSAFARNFLVFLGFILTPEGLKVDPKRFEKIRNLKPATNVKKYKCC